MLAGLPKAPSLYNPIANPQRAKQRQQYVLRRMRELGYITAAQYDEALKAPAARSAAKSTSTRFTPSTSPKWCGRRSPSTTRTTSTRAASASTPPSARPTRKRPTPRCARACWNTTAATATAAPRATSSCRPNVERGRLRRRAGRASGQRRPARRGRAVGRREAGRGRAAHRREDRRSPARACGSPRARSIAKTAPQKRIRRGAIIRVQREGKSWQIVQLPEVEAAFISLDPQDGAIRALVGGFDFNRNKFNHVTQAWRQPGSSFKPFIYSAALEKGFTPATVITDEPVVLEAERDRQPALGAEELRRQVRGPDAACAPRSPSRRTWSRSACCRRSAPKYAQDYITRFGFDAGAASALPHHGAGRRLGHRAGRWRAPTRCSPTAATCVQPYFIHKIVDDRGNVLALAEARAAPATRRCA